MTALHRRTILSAIGAAALAPSMALSQPAYPNKVIKIIVPLPAGGAADAGARILADGLQRHLKQPVIIDNKPGGTYVIGMQALGSAPPDGYTLIALNSGMIAAQVTMRRFDVLKSVTPIMNYGYTPTLFVVSAKSRFKSINELIAHGKANPGKLNFGTVGPGTLEHLWCSAFTKNAGLEATHIPFKGLPDAIPAMVQGEIDFIPAVYPAAQPFVDKGLLRTMGVISAQRMHDHADIPTLREQGINAPIMEFWAGLGAPAGTPGPIIDKLRSAMMAVLLEPEVQQKFTTLGTTLVKTPAEGDLKPLIQKDLVWMRQTADAAGIKLD